MLIDEFYGMHYDNLLRFARSLTRDDKRAEDLVQDTFLKALVHIITLEGLTDYQQKAWLFKALRNGHIDQFRKQRFERPMNPEDEPEINPDDFTVIEMKEVIQTLPTSLQDIIYKRYWLGLTSKQIADPLGLSDATVRDRLRTAIHLLRKQLNR
jgi:RNA polymerase sigma-70 factor, ECF subfamily